MPPSRFVWMAVAVLMVAQALAVDFGDYQGFTSASNLESTALYIGTNATDAEASNPTSGNGTTDDLSNRDDEDLIMPAFTVGSTTTLTVRVFLNTATFTSARLGLWVDWNGDGDVLDTNETQTVKSVTGTGNQTFSLTPPAGTVPGTKYLRLRVRSGTTAPTFSGASASTAGEVEDYPITVSAAPVDPNAYQVLVANYGGNVNKHDASGTFVAAVAAGSLVNPSELAAGADGNVIVSSEGASRIDRINPNTNAFISTLIAAGSNGLSLPGGMIVGSDNVLYIGDYSTDKLFRFNAGTGAFIGTTTVGGPAGLSLDSNHKVIILSEDSARVDRYSTTGTLEATIHSFGAWMDAHGMAMDLAGNYYFCNQGASTVDRITPGGTRSTFATLDAGSVPFSISIGPDGNIWVGDVGHNQIEEFSSTGVFIGRYSTNVNNPCGILAMPLSASDFGDLPSTYATRLAHNGARHIIGTLRMGTNLDADGDGLASTGGNGDDSDSDGDDEDGVTIPTLAAGSTASVTVNSSGTGKINAFFDWNNDKDFLDSGEVITEMSVATGNNTLNVPVPAAAVTGTLIGARFRLSTAGALTATGGAVDGEVEDYLVTVTATTDFGDWNGASAATATTSSTANSNLRLGASVDTESTPTTNAGATGDDTTGSDDEDGVALPCKFIAGAPSSLYLTYTNTTASNAFINAWVDFNGNGSFADAGEQVATNHTAFAGLSGAVAQILFTVPSSATVGTAGVRVRLTSVSSPGATGAAGTGEIEDYAVPVVAAGSTGGSPLLDYNVIARNNLSVVSDVEGRMIMKNLTSTSSVTMAKNLTGYPAGSQSMQVQTSVAAGGSVNLQYGSLYLPSSGALNGRTVNYNGGGALQTTPVPDFTGIFGGIVSASSAYALLAANNAITVPGSPAPLTLNVTALDANGVAIFSIDGNTLLNNGNVQSIDINLNGNNPAAILINCTGTSINYSSSGNFIGNFVNPLIRPKILWNFPNATSLTLGKSFYGSILAPNASVNATAGAVEGSVACNDLTSNIEIHLPVFQGCIVPPATLDFGDWNGSGASTTTASSTVSTSIRLGATVDVEHNVTPDTAATADGADEDGVTMPANITPGASVTIPVRVFNNNTAGRQLQAWIDFNNDGTFNNTDVTSGGERIYNAATTASASQQTINVTFTVPAAAAAGQWAGARFRISDTSATTPTSSGATGEIEDYMVSINAPLLLEWDMNQGHYNTALNPNYIDPCITGGVFQMFATSPLPFISDDPAGVNGPSKSGAGLNEAAPGEGFATLRCGQGFPATFNSAMQVRPRTGLTAIVSKTWAQFTTSSNLVTGSITGFVMDIARQGIESPTHVQAYLTWFDGTTHRTAWTAAYALEAAYFNAGPITDGHPAWRKINLGAFNAGGDALPINNALAGRTFLLELHIYGDTGSATDTLEFDNFALTGTCATSTTDYGDYSGFADATQTVNSAIRIGTAITDGELSSPANTNATGDDLVLDDEDLTMPSLTVGSATTLSVPITLTTASLSGGTSRVGVYADWNGDGDVADTNETLAVQAAATNGASTLSFSLTPPTGTVPGIKYLRIRAAEGSVHPGFTGTSTLKGEVEDYAISVGCVAITLSPSTLPNGAVNSTYSQPLTAAPPVANFWEIVSGTLPPGISINPSTGALTGTPTTAGTYNFTVTATEQPSTANGQLVATTYNLDLNPGNTFNIRDYLYDKDSPNRPIDWSKVTFYYEVDPSPSGWNLSNFNAGFPVTVSASDASAAGNEGTGRFRIFWRRDDQAGADDRMTIRVDSGVTSVVNSAKNVPLVPTACTGSRSYSIVINPPLPVDMGDWNGSGAATTTTTSVMNSTLRLGATVDSETSVTPNAAANADGADEDGVYLPAMRAGSSPVISVRLHNQTGSAAFLNAWMDFNNDGDFADAGEQILTNQSVPTGLDASVANNLPPSYSYKVSIPANAVTGTALGVRFRLTNVSGTGATGSSGTGEVEDYVVTLQPACVSNLLTNGSFEQGTTVIAGPRTSTSATDQLIGPAGWTLVGGTAVAETSDNRAALLDDYHLGYITANQGASGSMYQDASVTPGNTHTLTFVDGLHEPALNSGSVSVQYLTSANAAISGYSALTSNITYDMESLWPFTTMSALKTLTLPPAPPTAAKVRVTVSFTRTGAGWDAAKVDGLCLRSNVPPLDYGDYSVFGVATQASNADLRIGISTSAATDAEAANPANSTASGDDSIGDDEDLTMPAFTIGTATTLPVPVTVTSTANLINAAGRVGVWADWNGDGDVSDTGETVSVQSVASAGTTNLNFSLTPPLGVTPGTRYLRIRATEGTTSPAFSSTWSLKGEVEDYPVTVNCQTITVTAPSLPGWFANRAYPSATFTSSGGFGTITWSQTGALPPGMNFSTGGVLSGTPTAEGSYTFTARAQDQSGCAGTATVTVVIGSMCAVTDADKSIYVIDPASGGNAVVTTNAAAVGNFTAVAMDPVSGDIFYVVSGASSPRLGRFTLSTRVHTDLGQISTTMVIQNLGFFNGAPHFVPNASDDLQQIVISGSAIGSVTKMADLNANTNYTTVGDLSMPVANQLYFSAGNSIINYSMLSGTRTTFRTISTAVNPTSLAGTGGATTLRAFYPSSNQLYSITSAAETVVSTMNPSRIFVDTCGGDVAHATTDFGDWAHVSNPTGAATTTASSVVNSNLRLGSTVDAESAVSATSTATADDSSNTGAVDDEDGVTMPSGIMVMNTVTIPVSVLNNTGALAYLHSWIDLNNDGVFANALIGSGGERLVAAQSINTSGTAQAINVTFTVPTGIAAGSTVGARFRLTADTATTPTVVAGIGETEDYVVQLQACPVIAAISLPNGVAGTAYAQGAAFSVSPVVGSTSWSATGLPSGLSLGSGTGLITGTTTQVGSFRVNVTATNTNGCVASRVFPLRITGCGTNNVWGWNWDSTVDTLNGGNEGGGWRTLSFAQDLATGNLAVTATMDVTTNATQGLWFMINNGPDPTSTDPTYAAVYLFNGSYYVTPYASNPTTTHTLGTIITSGTYTTSLVGNIRTFSLTLPVNTINSWAGGGATWKGIGFPLNAQGNAAGNSTSPYRIGVWARSFADGSVNYNAATRAWTVTWGGGADPNIDTWDLVDDFQSPCCPLVIKPATLPSGSTGIAYTTTTFDADWGLGGYSYSIVAGGSLPPGLTLIGGVLSGTPNTAGTYNFTVRANDSGLCTGTQAYSVTIAASPLTLGNLIFLDNNNNTRYDAGDAGLPGVVVQLYNSSNALVSSTTTLNTSTSSPVATVEQAHSSVWIDTLAGALSCLSGTNRSAYWSGTTARVNYLVPGDTDGRFTTGNTDFPTGSSQGYVIRVTGNIVIPTTGTYTFGMTLDDVGRLRINGADVIVDDSGLHAVANRFGTVSLAAGTHTFEMIYLGVWGGSVELYAQSGTHSTWNTGFKLLGDTAGGGLAINTSTAGPDSGKYLFTGLSAGSYYVKIPASEFAVGKPLYRKESVLTTIVTPTDDNRDDNATTGSSDDGIDAADPTADGVRSPLVTLGAGAEPVNAISETGFYNTDDDAADANGNLTVDFGFRSATNGCWHFSLRDTNYDDWFETNVPPQSTSFTQGGVVTYIDTLDMTYHTGTKRFTYDATFVQKSGKRLDGFYYIISNDPEPFGQTQQAIMYVDVFDRSRPKVTLYVYDPALYDYTSGDTAISYTNAKMLASSQTANSPINVWTTESGGVLKVHIAADFTSVNNHLNFPTYGLTSAWEGFAFDENAGIWSHYYDLVGAPVYNGSFQLTNWNYNPSDFWGTVSYVDTHDGTPIFTENLCEEKVGVGNLVYKDANGDGNYDTGEGVDNVLVYLYRAGQSAGLDLPVAALLTSGGGEYFFNGISPGSYFLHIPSSEFGAGKPLVGTMSLPGTGTSDDHLDEDGLDVVSPSTSGISTAIFTLTANAEPTDADSELGFDKTGDNSDDNNSDLTIDFGFRTATSAGLGNLVFIDSNANGRYDGADTGVGGVKVELVNSGSGTVVATTTTDGAPVSQTGFQVTQMNTGSTVVSTYAAANTQLASANASNSQTVIAQTLNYYTAGTDGRFSTGNSAFPMGSFSNFLVRATGVITIPSAGTWSFGMSSDDGGRLRIDGADVIVDDTQHPVADRFGSRTLTAGTHTIEVTYWAFSGNDVLEVYATAGSFTSWTSSFKLIGDTANGGLPVVTTSATNTAGRYLFSGVAAGTYYLRIPSSEFASGKALFGYASFNNGSPTDDQKDDNSVTGSSDSGIDSISPTTLGIVTAPITLTLGSEPTNAGGETGFLGTQDDAFDSNYDLTADFAMIPASFDFGDWARATNPSGAATTTTKSMVTGTLRLGAAVDSETSVNPNAAATADGADDDAVTIPATISEGQIVNLNVSLLNNTGANATLSLWVDYDNDGVFNDSVFSFASAPTGEKVTTPLTVTPSSSMQSVALSFPVPVTASTGAQRGLRLRLSSDGGVTTPTGEGGSGEIEDYVVRICPADLIQPETAEAGRLGTPYLQTFTAPAGSTPLVWSAAGTVPGLTFNSSTAELSGIPTTEGVFTLRVTVTDANGCFDTNAFSIVIGGGNGMQCPDPLSEALGTSGRRWGYSASGPPYEPGLSILAPYANEGVLAGTSMRLRGASVAAITYTSTNCITSASRTTPALGGSGRYFRDTFAGVTSGTVADTDTQTSGYSCWMPNFGSGYQFTLSVTPAKAVTPAGIYWESVYQNITFSDVLVNGVSVATNIGPVASGMVQADTSGTQMPNYYYFVPFTSEMGAGTSYTITLRASGGIDPVIGDFSLLGCCACSSIALSPAGPALPAGTVGVSYSTSVAGTGGQTPYYYSVISGALPAGMKLDPSSGSIFGDPSSAGTASFTIEARDANDCTGTAAYTISVVSSTTDYGDLPDTSAGTATGNYQTLSTDSGASHTMSANLRLGLTVDGEVNGQPNAFATGDGADDDGVTSWPFFQRGATVNIPVSLFNNLAAARLFAFIDWNNNGSFADANEVISAVTVGMSSVQQTVNVPVTVPAGATLGCVGLRLRLATATTLTATGNTGNGEVEDYFMTVLNSGNLQDYGDHLYGSLANSASNVASSAIYIGVSAPDGEAADPSNAGSNADDLAGNDEDYDNFGTISSGGISGLSVDVTQCSALAAGSFGIWVDWNGDNDFADTHEVVTISTTLTPGLNSLPFVFTCPAGTTPGVKYVRLRAQQGSTTPSPTGVSTTLFGEVEDGTITVVAASEDRGDCMMFSDATATVNSNLRLGSVATDADTHGNVNAGASADDGTGADDEDGVALYAAYASGMSSQITIVVTNNTGSPAYLSGWIDFNNTPGTIEANEVVISNVTIPTGLTNAVQTYSFTVPAGIMTTRDVCARFRLSSVNGTGIAGSGGNGEVEDYLVRVCPVQACGVTGIVKN